MNHSQVYEALAGLARVMERYPDTVPDLEAIHSALTSLVTVPAPPRARRQQELERFADLWRRTRGMETVEQREAIMQRQPCGRTKFYDLREECQERGMLI